MKLVIFGANGKTGKLLVEQALEKGHEVIAYVRREGSITLKNPKLKVVTGQLNDTEKLHEAIAGSDVCLSTLGAHRITKRSPEITRGIDLITGVMEQEHVHRLIYMSSIGVGDSKYLMGKFLRFIIVKMLLREPMADHNANEKRIAQSHLDWTVVRPGSLSNDKKADKVRVGSGYIKLNSTPTISRASVASVMLDQIDCRDYIRQGIWAFE